MISNSSSALEIPKLTLNERSLYFSLVIPTYNESQNIKELVTVLSKLLDEFLPNNYELIVVDDDSPDRTWEVAESLVGDYPQLKVLRRKGERGLSTAVIRGWQNADGEVLGVIDGDLQHPPERLLKLLAAIQNGADLAVASRHIETGGVSNWNLARRFLSRGAQLLGLIILPGVIGRVSDPMSGYFAVRRDAICDRPLHPIGYKILIEVLARGAISKVTEIGYIFQERQEGESKVTWKQYLEYISHLIRLRLSLGEFRRFLRFGLVGFSGVFVDMAVLYLLHDPASLGWGLTRSKFIAGEIAIINNFLWNDAWTFRDLSNKQSTWKSKLKRFIKFNLVCLIGLGLNVVLLNLFFNILHIHYLVANFLAIALVTVWNFWINLKLSWRVTDTDR
jgi:dolichol-phosphate mannosyltransferase